MNAADREQPSDGAVSSGAAPLSNCPSPPAGEVDPPLYTLRRVLLIDPATGREGPGSLCVQGDRLKWIGTPDAEPEGEVYDLVGLAVCPGLIDAHVHLRVPGQEHKEDLVSGTEAAVAGGFTAVCCMPNTTPALDRPERIAALRERIAREARCRVHVVGAATGDNQGEELTDFAALREAGCVAITDDAFPLQQTPMMAEALRQAHKADLPFLAHLELMDLSRRAVLTAGPVAEALGLPGQDPAAETQALLRWVEAADGIARLHLLHLTTAASARLLHYLRPGPFFERISGETAPHYLLLTAEAVRRWGADAKMNPPLREERDRLALLGALRNGDIEVLATDHAPHSPQEKALGLAAAPFGITGLETALGLVITYLVNTGHLTLLQALGKMCTNPARLLGLAGGTLEPGAPADLTIIDLHKPWTVDPAQFHSKSRATPFAGERLVGKAWGTIVGGEWKMKEGEVL